VQVATSGQRIGQEPSVGASVVPFDIFLNQLNNHYFKNPHKNVSISKERHKSCAGYTQDFIHIKYFDDEEIILNSKWGESKG